MAFVDFPPRSPDLNVQDYSLWIAMERHQQGNAQARGFHAQKQEGVQGAAHGEIEEDSLVIACSHRQECSDEHDSCRRWRLVQ